MAVHMSNVVLGVMVVGAWTTQKMKKYINKGILSPICALPSVLMTSDIRLKILPRVNFTGIWIR